jgi:chitosanase
MNLTRQQKSICDQLINVFESGTPRGDYGAIATMNDGPGGAKQISYGKAQVTESGLLDDLINQYIANTGRFKDNFSKYKGLIGNIKLTNDRDFKMLLKVSATDPIMQKTQDAFFDERFFEPAMKWADNHGFTLPLSALVIYDSFIHSGSILSKLRGAFAEPTPAKGGDEKLWVECYSTAREHWLANHKIELLHNTTYRSRLFLEQMKADNWDLSKPISVKGYKITG